MAWTGPAAALHASLLDPLSDKWKHWRVQAASNPPRPARHVPNAGRLNAALRLPETKPFKHFEDVTSVAPNTFAKPQPRLDLSRILNWEDQSERFSPQSNTNTVRKGILEKILLVTDRRRLENGGSNDAPAWPPAPELIANPPNWGPEASHALGLSMALPIESNLAPGYFIGRDGTEWPLPPSECMPKPSLSPIMPPRTLPALTLDGDKWTAPIVAPNGAQLDDDAPFDTSGDEVYIGHGTLSCSTVATALLRTPADDEILLPVRKANRKAAWTVECAPHCGVIGEGRPKPQPACPPTPFLGPNLRLPSPPFLGSQAGDVESESGFGGGYWSDSESGSEYSEFDSDESDVWSGSDVASAHGNDADDESDSESDFFFASAL